MSRLPDPTPSILCRVQDAAVRERTLPNDDYITLPLRAAGPTAARTSATRRASAKRAGVPCRRRPYWTLACPLSTRSGWDGCSSRQQSSIFNSSDALLPAGFLQTDARVHHTVTQDSPSRGAVTGHSQRQVHTLSRNNAGTRFRRERTTTEQSKWEQHLTPMQRR